MWIHTYIIWGPLPCQSVTPGIYPISRGRDMWVLEVLPHGIGCYGSSVSYWAMVSRDTYDYGYEFTGEGMYHPSWLVACESCKYYGE